MVHIEVPPTSDVEPSGGPPGCDLIVDVLTMQTCTLAKNMLPANNKNFKSWQSNLRSKTTKRANANTNAPLSVDLQLISISSQQRSRALYTHL